MKNKKINNGSLTLEAAIVVPVFISLMLFINGLFVLFMGQQILSHTLIQSAKSMAFDPYVYQRVSENDEDQLADMFVDIFSFVSGDYVSTENWYEEGFEGLDEVIKARYIAYLRGTRSNASLLIEEIGVKDGLDGLDFSESTIDDGILTIKMKYTQEFIFNVEGLTSFDRELCVKVKLFEYTALE